MFITLFSSEAANITFDTYARFFSVCLVLSEEEKKITTDKFWELVDLLLPKLKLTFLLMQQERLVL